MRLIKPIITGLTAMCCIGSAWSGALLLPNEPLVPSTDLPLPSMIYNMDDSTSMVANYIETGLPDLLLCQNAVEGGSDRENHNAVNLNQPVSCKVLNGGSATFYIKSSGEKQFGGEDKAGVYSSTNAANVSPGMGEVDFHGKINYYGSGAYSYEGIMNPAIMNHAANSIYYDPMKTYTAPPTKGDTVKITDYGKVIEVLSPGDWRKTIDIGSGKSWNMTALRARCNTHNWYGLSDITWDGVHGLAANFGTKYTFADHYPLNPRGDVCRFDFIEYPNDVTRLGSTIRQVAADWNYPRWEGKEGKMPAATEMPNFAQATLVITDQAGGPNNFIIPFFKDYNLRPNSQANQVGNVSDYRLNLTANGVKKIYCDPKRMTIDITKPDSNPQWVWTNTDECNVEQEKIYDTHPDSGKSLPLGHGTLTHPWENNYYEGENHYTATDKVGVPTPSDYYYYDCIRDGDETPAKRLYAKYSSKILPSDACSTDKTWVDQTNAEYCEGDNRHDYDLGYAGNTFDSPFRYQGKSYLPCVNPDGTAEELALLQGNNRYVWDESKPKVGCIKLVGGSGAFGDGGLMLDGNPMPDYNEDYTETVTWADGTVVTLPCTINQSGVVESWDPTVAGSPPYCNQGEPTKADNEEEYEMPLGGPLGGTKYQCKPSGSAMETIWDNYPADCVPTKGQLPDAGWEGGNEVSGKSSSGDGGDKTLPCYKPGEPLDFVYAKNATWDTDTSRRCVAKAKPANIDTEEHKYTWWVTDWGAYAIPGVRNGATCVLPSKSDTSGEQVLCEERKQCDIVYQKACTSTGKKARCNYVDVKPCTVITTPTCRQSKTPVCPENKGCRRYEYAKCPLNANCTGSGSAVLCDEYTRKKCDFQWTDCPADQIKQEKVCQGGTVVGDQCVAIAGSTTTYNFGFHNYNGKSIGYVTKNGEVYVTASDGSYLHKGSNGRLASSPSLPTDAVTLAEDALNPEYGNICRANGVDYHQASRIITTSDPTPENEKGYHAFNKGKGVFSSEYDMYTNNQSNAASVGDNALPVAPDQLTAGAGDLEKLTYSRYLNYFKVGVKWCNVQNNGAADADATPPVLGSSKEFFLKSRWKWFGYAGGSVNSSGQLVNVGDKLKDYCKDSFNFNEGYRYPYFHRYLAEYLGDSTIDPSGFVSFNGATKAQALDNENVLKGYPVFEWVTFNHTIGSLVSAKEGSTSKAFVHLGLENGKIVKKERTWSEELTNFATWFSFYSRRDTMAKTLSLSSLNHMGLNKIRIGFIRLNSFTAVHGFLAPSLLDQAHKDLLLESIAAMNINPRYIVQTPSIVALRRIGDYYTRGTISDGLTAEDPIKHRCQRNFYLYFTDGATYDSPEAKIGTTTKSEVPNNDLFNVTPRRQVSFDGITYFDLEPGAAWPAPIQGSSAVTDTLADVAGYYWQTDMRSGMPNVKAPLEQGADPSVWQNMNFYALSLGVEGTVDKTSTVTQLIAKSQSPGGLWPENPERFNDPSETPNTGADDLWHATFTGFGKYINAQTPEEFELGLTTLVTEIQERGGSLAGVSLSNPNVQLGYQSAYQGSYRDYSWYGDVIKTKLYTDDIGVTISWSAATVLTQLLATSDDVAWEDRPWNKKRVIITTVDNKAVPFRYEKLGNNYLNNLANTSSTDTTAAAVAERDLHQKRVVAYLRGDETYTQGANPIFRKRVGPLGDIVNAAVVSDVDHGSWGYREKENPGYINYRPYDPNYNYAWYDDDYVHWYAAQNSLSENDVKTAKRLTDKKQQRHNGVVYAPSNDGMLHAFNSSNGQELWAFIPEPMLRPAVDINAGTVSEVGPGIGALAFKQYATVTGEKLFGHHYYIDATPVLRDIMIDDLSWKTVLIGGLGKGGKSYYALNVTFPEPVGADVVAKEKYLVDGVPQIGPGASNTANDTKLVRWQYSGTASKPLGFTYGSPKIVKILSSKPLGKTKKHWVAVLPSGYTTSTEDDSSIHIIDAWHGAEPSSGMQVIFDLPGFGGVAKVGDYSYARAANPVVENLYFGGLSGKLGRIDLSDLKVDQMTTAEQKVVTLVNLKKSITTVPATITAGDDSRWILTGTGRLLTQADVEDQTTENYVIALQDGNLERPYARESYEVPKTISDFVDRYVEENGANGEVAGETSKTEAQLQNAIKDKAGWFHKLGTGKKLVVDPILVRFGDSVTAIYAVTSIDEAKQSCGIGLVGTLYAFPLKGGPSVINLADSLAKDIIGDGSSGSGGKGEATKDGGLLIYDGIVDLQVTLEMVDGNMVPVVRMGTTLGSIPIGLSPLKATKSKQKIDWRGLIQ